MQKFPDAVIRAMHHAGTTATCMPVAFDADGVSAVMSEDNQHDATTEQTDSDSANWESAVFLVLPPDLEQKQLDRLFPSDALFPVGVEADLLELENATLIEIIVDVDIGLKDKVSGRILFVTGHMPAHYEAVQLLAEQESIGLFIGDMHCTLLHQQRIPLAEPHRQVFREMLQEALRRDALLRMTTQYDPEAAFALATQGS